MPSSHASHAVAPLCSAKVPGGQASHASSCVLKINVLKVHVLKVHVLKVHVIKVHVIKVHVLKVHVIKVHVLKVHVIKVRFMVFHDVSWLSKKERDLLCSSIGSLECSWCTWITLFITSVVA